MVTPNLERQLDYMEAELGKHEWFAGAAFSAADIQMSFPLEAASARGGLDESRPEALGLPARRSTRAPPTSARWKKAASTSCCADMSAARST